MKNPNAESCQAFFNMYIPEEAFISDFRMRIKDETFVAKVETKEQAKKIFEGSVGSSGLVSSKVEFKETNHVRTVNTGVSSTQFYLKNMLKVVFPYLIIL